MSGPAPPRTPPTLPASPRLARWRSWWTVPVAALIAAVIFLGLAGAHYFSLRVILSTMGSGVRPLELSLEFTTLSFVFGFFLATPLALLRAFPPGRDLTSDPLERSHAGTLAHRVRRFLRYPAYGFASGYVAAVRGTPFLVQLFIVYYAMIFAAPRFVFLGMDGAFWAGLIALTINTTGYQAEALRGGFQSVSHSQIESARAMGFTRAMIVRRIILPQGLRLVTLPLTNEWISNFKTSTILSYITIYELFSWARTYVALTLGHPVEAFVMLILYYLIINVTVSRTVSYIERRRRIPGLGSMAPEPGLGRASAG